MKVFSRFPCSLLLVAVFCLGCGGTLTPQQSTDISIGVNAAACVITNGAIDLAAGMQPGQVVSDLVVKCGVSVAQVGTIFDATAAAEDKAGSGALASRLRMVSAATRDGGP